MIIEPKKGITKTNLLELMQYKDLLYFLVLKEIKILYKQTILGPLWVWLVIKEQPSFETILGGVVIIITIAAHSLLALKKK